MFTDKLTKIFLAAKGRAASFGNKSVDLESVLAAMGADFEASLRLADCLTAGDVAALRKRCPAMGEPVPCPEKMEPDKSLGAVLATAHRLASGAGVPDQYEPGSIGVNHLACALSEAPDAVKILSKDLLPVSREKVLELLTAWQYENANLISLGTLINRLRDLRADLLQKVLGQGHAVQAIVEGLYNVGVTGSMDKSRRRPEGVFVFAGPPGVGKTYMAELFAAHLKRPFKRFDMTSYSYHASDQQLQGIASFWSGSQPGLLTEFVEKNPSGILLFDEIEKAHLNVMQLFYQILDTGLLEDKCHAKDVSFRNTLIIFTTNAGRSLYDNENRMGIGAANASYQKRTILDALEHEINPADGKPAFPPAICSRLGQGYPIMFNHLGVNELEKIADIEMKRCEAVLQRLFFRMFRHDDRLPMALVLREGAAMDARQLRAEADKFVKNELFRFCSLYGHNRIEAALEDMDEVVFSIEKTEVMEGGDIGALFDPTAPPRILLASDEAFYEVCRNHIPDFDWLHVRNAQEAIEKIVAEEVDFIMLDLWLGGAGRASRSGVDYTPIEARELDNGRDILKRIHERFPLLPVYLLSFLGAETSDDYPDDSVMPSKGPATLTLDSIYAPEVIAPFGEHNQRKPIDDELLLACVRAGGARGLIATGFGVGREGLEKEQIRQFWDSIATIHHRLYREKKARMLARERKVLSFDTVSDLDRENRILTICLRNFRLTRAMDAVDTGEMVEDISRPATRFEDVLGATEAKKSMQFIVDWLRNAKKYTALGLRPPKGILMAGPPGTGKTMLARAVAGESECAFIEKSATAFVTMWQGSGPQNIRDLFARARRYAPAIVFIDEIDAIGRERTGGPGSRSQEETLNALLTEMDGFGTNNSNNPVIVLAATNLVQLLDEALKRRFDRTIEVDKPDRDARLTWLKGFVAARIAAEITDITLERIAGQSAGMTIADLERIAQDAGVMAAQQGTGLNGSLLDEAFEKARHGVASQAPNPETLLRIARHEAGHTLIAWHGGNKPVQVTIVGRMGMGGFMERETSEEQMLYTKPQLEQCIRECMAGRAAEIIYYGGEDGLSTGASDDLRRASQLAARMVRELGMDNEIGPIAVDVLVGSNALDGPLGAQVVQQSRQILKTQMQQVMTFLEDNRLILDTIVNGLVDKNRLTRQDLDKLLKV